MWFVEAAIDLKRGGAQRNGSFVVVCKLRLRAVYLISLLSL